MLMNDSWIKKGQREIDKIMGKMPPSSSGGFFSNMIFAIDRAIGGASAVVEKKEEKRADLSPGKQEMLKAI